MRSQLRFIQIAWVIIGIVVTVVGLYWIEQNCQSVFQFYNNKFSFEKDYTGHITRLFNTIIEDYRKYRDGRIETFSNQDLYFKCQMMVIASGLAFIFIPLLFERIGYYLISRATTSTSQ